MRTLPQTPNLEHLKQQAKDLLEAIRETTPDASLADAQRTLAQQYGHRTWADLKHDVERMRGHAVPADQDTARAVARAFGLGDLVSPAVLVSVELGAPLMRIETERGRWSAHAMLEWMDAAQVEEGGRLLEAAVAAGIEAPRPVRSASGNLIEDAGEATWRVDAWMDLGPPLAKPMSRGTARRIGEALGTLHNLRLAPAHPMNPWISQRRSAERWQEILERVRSLEAPWAQDLEHALPAIADLSTIPMSPAEDLILSHTNLPANVRTGSGGSLVVLGWEFAGATPPAWELGYVLHSCTEGVSGTVHAAPARALVDAYTSVTGSTPPQDLSIFASAVNAWHSWLISRMNIALSDSPPEREQATKELMSMLRAPLSRARLERILEATVTP